MPVMGNERADLAAASALSLPGMLTWLGIQHSSISTLERKKAISVQSWQYASVRYNQPPPTSCFPYFITGVSHLTQPTRLNSRSPTNTTLSPLGLQAQFRLFNFSLNAKRYSLVLGSDLNMVFDTYGRSFLPESDNVAVSVQPGFHRGMGKKTDMAETEQGVRCSAIWSPRFAATVQQSGQNDGFADY